MQKLPFLDLEVHALWALFTILDPIIGVDTTADGKWILATTKTYLLVIPTEFQGGKSGFEVLLPLPSGLISFKYSMGKDKPAPRRLQLRREHIAQMGGKVSSFPMATHSFRFRLLRLALTRDLISKPLLSPPLVRTS